MSIKNTLNEEQKEAFETLQKFTKHTVANTFVLQGYAGTGKTFLMQHFAKWLKEKDINFTLLASTGRAATVLRGKTGFEAKTVHGELYRFSKVDGDSDEIKDDASIDSFGQMRLQFSLRPPDEAKQIYIVDEASMLSSEFNDGSNFANFGSGALVQDLFEAIGNNKVIFVGDPCQLPPVGQDFSPVLDMDWLNNENRVALTSTLKTIERTNAGNDILKLAYSIRSMVSISPSKKYPKLGLTELSQIKLTASIGELFRQYLESYKQGSLHDTIAIARSNKLVRQINRAMRRDLFGKVDMPIQIGDVLLVTQNNYKVPLTNGDFVTVVLLGEVRQHVNLYFQSVRVKSALSDEEHEVLLSLDILYGDQPNFTEHQVQALMVDFSKRMRAKGIRPNSEQYKAKMKEDDYVNCLRATYGYAVTCHKAQGGEWDKVFLFLDRGMYSIQPPNLFKWWYTAITRAKKELYTQKDWWVE